MKTNLVQLVGILVAITMFSLIQATNPTTELGALLRFRAAIPKLQRPWDVTKKHCSWLGIECHNGVVVVVALSTLNLTGTVPSNTVGVLNGLRRLFLHANQLSGPLPSDIGDAPLLNVLRLELNAFSGNLPPSLGNLKHLLEFNVSNNPLEGEIPGPLQHWSPRVYIKTKLCGKPLRVCPAPPPSPPPPSPPSPHPPNNANPPPSPTDHTKKLLEIILPSVGIAAVGVIGVLLRSLYKKYFKSSSEVEMNQGLNNEASKNSEMMNQALVDIALTNAYTLRADARARENESKAKCLQAEADLEARNREAEVDLEARNREAEADLAKMQPLGRDARSTEVQADSALMQELEREAKKKVLEWADMQPKFGSACLRPPPNEPRSAPPALPHHTWATSSDEESADHDITTIDDHSLPERESKLACSA